MINKSIFEWEEQDLQDLINDKISESLSLEYKQTIDIKPKKDKKELCKDVSAMSNAFGGKIIYGIKESSQKDAGSIPVVLTPIKDHSLKESMQQVLTDGILPRMDFLITGFESQQFPDHEYVVIDIPQTLRGPHFVCLDGVNRFYKRRDFEAKTMDQREIEDAYRNFFFQEMKMNNLYDQIKKENPNISKAKGQPESAYCFLYFIPQYPVDGLFYTKFNHSSLTDSTKEIYGSYYLKAYNDVFYNSYDGLTNICKNGSFVQRMDTFYRNGCVGYSFSLFNDSFITKNNSLISFDSFGHSVVKIVNFVREIYNECGYKGNVSLVMKAECIDNYKLFSSSYFSSDKSVDKGIFFGSISTSIDKLLINSKQELKPLFSHFIQSFGVDDEYINNFFKKVYFEPIFGK